MLLNLCILLPSRSMCTVYRKQCIEFRRECPLEKFCSRSLIFPKVISFGAYTAFQQPMTLVRIFLSGFIYDLSILIYFIIDLVCDTVIGLILLTLFVRCHGSDWQWFLYHSNWEGSVSSPVCSW
uniref:Uncharacterized protein n=1 Tax=Cacopsylla melanoneura TaxID=428564 RepID=A0A8D8R3G4_9HEMI